MRSVGLKAFLGAAAITLTASGAQAGAIAANPNPISFDAGFGKIDVGGQLSGLAFYQSNAKHAMPGDASSYMDLGNALITVSKSEGTFQFYIAGGLYALPTVGYPYTKASTQNSALGPIPVAYAKLQLTKNFSVSAGKLPTLVGAELAFTPQNINIERGLLWWQEPISSRGVQVNYDSGPFSIALSWNDGYYTNVWNTFSALASVAIDDSNTLAFDTSITPEYQGNAAHQIYDLMYSYSAGAISFGPYVQYEHTGKNGGDLWGIGLLGSYQLTPEWSLNARAEYEDASKTSVQMAYGPGSKAYSITFTPTYQKGIFFARGELSYAGISDQGAGLGFGRLGTKDGQFRAMFETGIVF